MTRKEAIAILKSKMDGSVDTSYEWAETVRMAIEALSNYITESPNDVVESKNDVIKKPRTVRYKLHKPIEYVSIEFDEEETITHIDHYTAYGERREMTREDALEVFSTVKERSEHFKECGCRFPLWTITERDAQAIDMAIEALKAQENIIPLDGEDIMFVTTEEFEKIKAREWIPVSERLPETIGEYLITALSKPSRNAIVSAGYWNERLKEFGTFRQDGTWEKWDVIAWMPLSEPYKEGDTE